MKCRELIRAHPLVMARISYFCMYAAFSVYFPYLPIFYEERVTNDSELVGTLLAFRPLLMLVAAPLWGGIADKYNRHRDVLIFLLVAASVFRFAMSFATTFPTAITLLITAELFGGSVNSVMDSIALKLLGDERKGDYGKLRLWGAVSWGSFSTLGGAVMEKLGILKMFYMYTFLISIAMVFVWFLDPRDHETHYQQLETSKEDVNGEEGVASETELVSQLKDENKTESSTSEDEQYNVVAIDDEGEPNGEVDEVEDSNRDSSGSSSSGDTRQQDSSSVTTTDTFFLKLKRLMTAPAVATFALVVWTMGTLMGVISNFLFVWLQQLGGGTFVMGLSLTFTCISEVPFFYFSGEVIRKLGHMTCLTLALVCYGIRLVYYSLLVEPYWVLPIELLHGITFGIGWACCVSFSHQVAPEGLAATTQGLLASVHWGIGNAGGAFLGGVLFEEQGPRRGFRYSLILVGLGLAFVGLSWYRSKRAHVI